MLRLTAPAIVGLLLLALPGGAVAAQDAPVPPCANGPRPPYPEPGAPPNVQVWSDGDLARTWTPPACTGWTSQGFGVLVALAGSFRDAGTIDDLLARFGAVSALEDVRYWSVSDEGWRPLVTDASALDGPDPDRRRPDFSASELAAGSDLFFVQNDSRSSGDVVYRMRVRQREPDRAVIETENVSAVSLLFVPLFEPGDLQSVSFLERGSPDVWNFYNLARTGTSPSMLTRGHEASYVNRAVALYRHLARIPTDREPPAAR